MAASNRDLALAAKKEGNGHYKKKEWAEAIAKYTEAIALDATDHTFYSNRSACYAGSGDYENSLADANKVIEINPSFPKGYSRKGLALLKLQRGKEAKEAYQAGLEHSPTDAALRKGFESSMKASGEGMIPRLAFVQAMQDPEIANWYQTDANFKTAIDVMVNGFPAQQQIMGWFMDPKIQKFLQKIGMIPQGAEVHTPQAKPSFGAAKKDPTKKSAPAPEPELDPEEQEKLDRKNQADEIKARGTAEYKEKNFEAALELYAEASELCPKEPVYKLNIAAVQLMTGDLDGCEASCQEAVEISREYACDYMWDAKAYNRLATVEERRGNLDAALGYLEDSCREVNDSKVRSRMKKLKQRKRKADAQSLLSPEDALEYKSKGDDFFRAGNFREAVDMYTEAIKRNPNDPKVYNNRSTSFCKFMAWAPALEDAEKAIALSPTWSKPYLRKAKIYQALQKMHKSLITLKHAKVVVENPNEINKSLRDLKIAIHNAGTDETRQQRAMEDPEIKCILADPVISNLLKKAETEPMALGKAMIADEHIRDSIEMLQAAGILRLG